jgi:hypothetical protein
LATHPSIFFRFFPLSYRHIIFSKAVVKPKPKKLAVAIGNNRQNKGTPEAKPKHPFEGKEIKKPKGNDG